MRKTPFKLFGQRFPKQFSEFMKMVDQWEKDTGDSRDEFALEKYEFIWNWKDVPAYVVVATHIISGPREPDWVFTGERWICSEMDLTDDEVKLMDTIAEQCPGGLGGWS